jgi:hypothetical protein
MPRVEPILDGVEWEINPHKQVKISQSTISAVLTGARSLTKEQVLRLAKFFQVFRANIRWIRKADPKGSNLVSGTNGTEMDVSR